MNYYDQIATGYEELHKEEQLKKIEIIKKHLKTRPNDKILDVGCGTGLTTEPWPCKRYGIDPSEKLLEKAENKQRDENKQNNNKNNKIEYKLAPAEKIPYKDDFFDIIVSITAIQNFNNIEKGLNEIKRVGKDKFILSFLKRSKKKEKIKQTISKLFQIEKTIEEEKDLIFFCKSK